MPSHSNDDVKPKSSRKNLTFLQPAPPDASPNVHKAASRYITVEPITLFLAFSLVVTHAMLPQFLRDTIATQRNLTLPRQGDGNSSTCMAIARNRSNPAYALLQDVQADVAYWQMMIMLCGSLPALFVCPLLGAWSDIVGRKIVLGINVAGFFASALSFLLTYHLVLPIWVIALGKCISGKYLIYSIKTKTKNKQIFHKALLTEVLKGHDELTTSHLKTS